MPRSSGQRRRNHNANGANATQASQIASCHRNVRVAGLKIPGGGAMRRSLGNSTRNVPDENTPSANQSRKNDTQIVPRLRINPAVTKFGNPLFSLEFHFLT